MYSLSLSILSCPFGFLYHLFTVLCLFFRAEVIISDLPEFIPLINMNIEVNKDLITGNTMAKALTWGEDTISEHNFDYVVLADCIYYEQVITVSPSFLVRSVFLIFLVFCDWNIFPLNVKYYHGNKLELYLSVIMSIGPASLKVLSPVIGWTAKRIVFCFKGSRKGYFFLKIVYIIRVLTFHSLQVN